MSTSNFISRTNNLPATHPLYRSWATAYNESDVRVIIKNYEKIDDFLQQRGIEPQKNARYSTQRTIMQEFLNTTSIPTEESFQSFTRSAIDLSMIWAVLSTHKKYQKLPRDIRVAFFKDPINPINNINSAGRDKLFEYYVGARFNAAGCSIRYDEPDVICNYKNIEFGVAAKRFRVENLQQHIKKARNQIEKSGLPGVIALDVTPSSPFTEHPYFETPDHFRHAADKWLFDVFHSQVNKYGDQWKLDGIKTPIIICFLQSIFAIEDGTLAFFAKKYILNINPKREPSKTEAIQIRIIQEAVESLRRTLPEADHAT